MLDLLIKIKQYIEDTETQIDSELGLDIGLSELIKHGHMPVVYGDLLKEIERLSSES